MALPMLNLRAIGGLVRALAHAGALRGKALGPRLREKLILHVSALNRCVACSVVHEKIARRVGVSEEEVRAVRTDGPPEELDDRTRAAFRYAELRTLGLEADFPDDVAAFERLLGAQEQREVRALADLFTFNNRFNNTWEGLLPGAAGRRRRLGLGDGG